MLPVSSKGVQDAADLLRVKPSCSAPSVDILEAKLGEWRGCVFDVRSWQVVRILRIFKIARQYKGLQVHLASAPATRSRP